MYLEGLLIVTERVHLKWQGATAAFESIEGKMKVNATKA
jgi:hypothetical protein